MTQLRSQHRLLRYWKRAALILLELTARSISSIVTTRTRKSQKSVKNHVDTAEKKLKLPPLLLRLLLLRQLKHPLLQQPMLQQPRHQLPLLLLWPSLNVSLNILV